MTFRGKGTVLLLVLTFFFYTGISGCATTKITTNSEEVTKPSLLERYNRAMFKFDMGLDRHILRPVSKSYVDVTPRFVRHRVKDFFSNLDQISVTINAGLQGKPQAIEDLTRFLFNTIFGIGGLFDVATPIGLPEHPNDFGVTLADWGVPEGPYIVLPIFGPSTMRDVPSLALDGWLLNPLAYYPHPRTQFVLTGLKYISARASLLSLDSLINEAPDPYAFVKSAYLQHRQFLIKTNTPSQPKKKNMLNPMQKELLEMNSK